MQSRSPALLFLVTLLLVTIVGCQILAFPINLLTNIIQGLAALFAKADLPNFNPVAIAHHDGDPPLETVVEQMVNEADRTGWPEAGGHLLHLIDRKGIDGPILLLPIRNEIESASALQRLRTLLKNRTGLQIAPVDLSRLLSDHPWKDRVQQRLPVPFQFTPPSHLASFPRSPTNPFAKILPAPE